jgi:hypothetical protein
MILRVLLAGLATFSVVQSPATLQGVAGTIGFAHVSQTSLRYHLAGNGPRTIVLLDELGMSLESWDDIVSESPDLLLPLLRRFLAATGPRQP